MPSNTRSQSAPWFKQLHWQIIIGLVLGVLYGIGAASSGLSGFTTDWIAPLGTIFVNLLRLIAVPLIVSSLVVGVASLSDLSKLSRIGGKTIAIYIGTTFIAITIGLFLVNTLQPGKALPQELSQSLQDSYQVQVDARRVAAEETKARGPLQPIVDMIPDNFFSAASNNRRMLEVVFAALFIGVGLIQVRSRQTKIVLDFFEGVNQVVIKMVDIIMLVAPIGVFALLAGTITSIAGDNIRQVLDLLYGLGFYCVTVVTGLILQVILVYGVLVRFLSPLKIKQFAGGIAPAQLVAFSTSSSGAALPVTMERCQDKLGVSEEVSSFVLPMGATVNMDGTALYQSVAAVFIAQALGMELGFAAQLTIILTALLASIGSAAVPGAGIIMLVIILEAIGVPTAGIALILGVDRILDMLRTTTNVTGDATVAVLVAASEGQLTEVKSVDG